MTWDELTEQEQKQLDRIVRYNTRRFSNNHDRDDCMQECWLRILNTLPNYKRSIAGVNTYFINRVRSKIDGYSLSIHRAGFTFGNWKSTHGIPERVQSENAQKKRMRPGGTASGFHDYVADSLPPSEKCRRRTKEETHSPKTPCTDLVPVPDPVCAGGVSC